MDFELFAANDEDDEMLGTMLMEPSQMSQMQLALNVEKNSLPEFVCLGEDSLNMQKTQFSSESFIKNGFAQGVASAQQCQQQFTLGHLQLNHMQLYSEATIQYAFGKACLLLQSLDASVENVLEELHTEQTLTYYEQRRQVSIFHHLLLQTVDIEQWPMLRAHFAALKELTAAISKDADWKKLYYASSIKGSQCQTAVYQLLHGLLETKLLQLCITYKYDLLLADFPDSSAAHIALNAFCEQVQHLFHDLIVCSLYLYGKKQGKDLLHSSPFPCVCFRELWLVLQHKLLQWQQDLRHLNAAEKLHFWSIFKLVMLELKQNSANYAITTLSYCEFANWILHALLQLQGYSKTGSYKGPIINDTDLANYDFCESCTQEFLSLSPSEEQLRIYICLLTPSVLQWWPAKINIPAALWEFFHKRLNAAFFMASATLKDLEVACCTGVSYIAKYREYLCSLPQDLQLSSFTLFALLMGKMIERLLHAHLNNQAQKLLGRIYIKFNAQKYLTLNETGIHHLTELFLTLALCGDFENLAPKFRDNLFCIALDKIALPRQLAVMKAHSAFLLLYAEKQLDMSSYIGKLLQQLSSVQNEPAVAKLLADTLPQIFEQADDFQRGEHLLIDVWLPQLLETCTPVEQERVLQAVHRIFEKVQRCELHVEASVLMRALNNIFLPFLKEQYIVSFSVWLPQLAADFCTHFSAIADTLALQRQFNYFVEAPAANREALPSFLLKVLESEALKSASSSSNSVVTESIIIHIWLKSLVLLTAQNKIVQALTKRVAQLPSFKRMTNLSEAELNNSQEPLCSFIAALGQCYNACSNQEQRQRLAQQFNACISNFDKWLPAEHQKQEQLDLLYRYYSFLAIVIYNCPQMAYVKSKLNCFLHIAITRFVLPTSILMGKTPEGKLAQCVHKVWHVIYQGIGKLNYENDSYLSRMLSDLLLKWLPHFKLISNNVKVLARPFLNCMLADNRKLCIFMLNHMLNFLRLQGRIPNDNANLSILILQEVLKGILSHNQCVDLLNLFIKIILQTALEHFMLVEKTTPSYNALFELLKILFGSAAFKTYSKDLQPAVIELLRSLIKIHLPYNPYFFFDLLMNLVELDIDIMQQIWEFLLREVVALEQNRGGAQDKRLRQCLKDLKKKMEQFKSKD